jgi:hypothetical protein
MPNTAQILVALSMAVWVVDVRFAPEPAPVQVAPTHVSCQSGPSGAPPAGVDFEFVVCAQRSKSIK